ncbi:MAG: hypothetical protein ACKOAD_07360, partial [Gammaproteobacteria bacterium]
CTAIRFGANRQIASFTTPNGASYQPALKHNTKVFIQFVFKGLAGVGQQNLDSSLRSAIPGYKFIQK